MQCFEAVMRDILIQVKVSESHLRENKQSKEINERKEKKKEKKRRVNIKN